MANEPVKDRVMVLLKELRPDERLDVFLGFCLFCGEESEKCSCNSKKDE